MATHDDYPTPSDDDHGFGTSTRHTNFVILATVLSSVMFTLAAVIMCICLRRRMRQRMQQNLTGYNGAVVTATPLMAGEFNGLPAAMAPTWGAVMQYQSLPTTGVPQLAVPGRVHTGASSAPYTYATLPQTGVPGTSQPGYGEGVSQAEMAPGNGKAMATGAYAGLAPSGSAMTQECGSGSGSGSDKAGSGVNSYQYTPSVSKCAPAGDDEPTAIAIGATATTATTATAGSAEAGYFYPSGGSNPSHLQAQYQQTPQQPFGAHYQQQQYQQYLQQQQQQQQQHPPEYQYYYGATTSSGQHTGGSLHDTLRQQWQ